MFVKYARDISNTDVKTVKILNARNPLCQDKWRYGYSDRGYALQLEVYIDLIFYFHAPTRPKQTCLFHFVYILTIGVQTTLNKIIDLLKKRHLTPKQNFIFTIFKLWYNIAYIINLK